MTLWSSGIWLPEASIEFLASAFVYLIIKMLQLWMQSTSGVIVRWAQHVCDSYWWHFILRIYPWFHRQTDTDNRKLRQNVNWKDNSKYSYRHAFFPPVWINKSQLKQWFTSEKEIPPLSPHSQLSSDTWLSILFFISLEVIKLHNSLQLMPLWQLENYAPVKWSDTQWRIRQS